MTCSSSRTVLDTRDVSTAAVILPAGAVDVKTDGGRSVTCPSCLVPFTRYGLAVQSTRFYRDDPDVCLPCREHLDPVTLLPIRASEPHALGAHGDLRDVRTETAPRTKAVYIGAPACFVLEEAIRPVCEAFRAYNEAGGCYVVGSALERADWRDVDVRLMMPDDVFAREFPRAGQHWEHNARWLLLTVAISEYLSKRTGLPIDFQFQPRTHANAKHKGRRNAIGLRFDDPEAVNAGATPSETGAPESAP